MNGRAWTAILRAVDRTFAVESLGHETDCAGIGAAGRYAGHLNALGELGAASGADRDASPFFTRSRYRAMRSTNRSNILSLARLRVRSASLANLPAA